ncbi:MAG: hypothetical protein PHG18_03715, partial [Bacilli bacterium]|nr:hypothetical protein [Bacilli bacterium]
NGNATSATMANLVNIDTVGTPISGDDMRVALILPSGGNQKVYMDNTLLYSSDRETLTVPNLKGNATSSNKTDSVFINYVRNDYGYLIPFVENEYDFYGKIFSADMSYNPYTNEISANFRGDLTGNASTSTTSGTANVALTLDDPSKYNLTDFNSTGATAYSTVIADGSGGIKWGATSGGINAKNYATAVAVSNVTQSGTGQTIDGQVCNEGATVLCVGQTIKASNGAWIIPESGAWTRRTDMDTWSELYQAYIPIVSGTTYGGSSWYCTIPSSGTLGVTDITFTEFLFPSSIEAGDGLTKTGTTLNTNVDNSSIEIHSDTLRVKDLGITTAKLANSSVTNAKIATGIDAAKIADGSVSNTEFQYINSVTSNIQTQINAKSPISNPTFTTNATSPKFTSTITTGTAPFTVASTTKVSNLNVDQIDGADLETTITNSDTKIPSSKAVITAMNLKANLASPALTGTPAAPTAAVGTNTTQLATTAFVQSAILYSPITQVNVSSYEITDTHYCVVAVGNCTDLYLPPATVSGKELIIKSAQVQSFTLHANGYDVIDGYSTITVNYWKSFMIKSAGNGHWYILATY